MAKTLTQAGGQTQGSMPSAGAVTATTSVAPAQIQVGDSLAKDLMGAMGEAANLTQTGYQVSENAAKRVALDMSAKLAKEEQVLFAATNWEDPNEIEAYNQAISAAQVNNSRKKFDNEDAQRAFDSMYTQPTAESIGHTISRNTVKANLMHEALTGAETLTNLNIQNNASIFATNDQLEVLATKDTALAGDTKLPAIWLGYANSSVTEFDNRFKLNPEGMLTDAGWNNKTGWTDEVRDNVFKIFINGYGKFNDDGTFKFYDNVQGEQTRDVIRATIDKTMKDFNTMLSIDYSKSSIPLSESSLRLNGSASHEQAKDRVQSSRKELANYVARDASVVNEKWYQTLEQHVAKIEHKTFMIKQAADSFQKFATGTIDWQGYINETANRDNTFKYKGNLVTIDMSEGNSLAFAKAQFEVYSETLRNMPYEEGVTKEGNMFFTAGKMFFDSDNNLNMSFLANNAKQLGETGYVDASRPYETIRGEFKKTVSYMKGGHIYAGSWVENSNDAIESLIFTLDKDVEEKDITKEQASTRLTAYLEGMHSAYQRKDGATMPDEYNIQEFEKALVSMTADRANTVYALNFGGASSERWALGAKTLGARALGSKPYSNRDQKAVDDYFVGNYTPIRNAKGLTGTLALPWKDTIMIYTPDIEIDGTKASQRISYEIEREMGDRYNTITRSDVTFRQVNSATHGVLLTVAIKENGKVIRLIPFTMKMLQDGSPLKKERDRDKKGKPPVKKTRKWAGSK